jgi:thioredoxin-like negative regulator of GroEL
VFSSLLVGPHFAMLSTKYPHTVFIKVDVDKIQMLSMRFAVSSMPTFVFIKNGQELSRFSGANAEKIEQMIIQFGGDKSVSFIDEDSLIFKGRIFKNCRACH